MVGKYIAGGIGGFILALFAVNIANLFMDSKTAIVFIVAWAIAIIITKKAESGAKAWRKLLALYAALSLVLPIAIFIKATQQTGALRVFSGFMTSMVFSIFCFLLALAFLVVRMFVGKE